MFQLNHFNVSQLFKLPLYSGNFLWVKVPKVNVLEPLGRVSVPYLNCTKGIEATTIFSSPKIGETFLARASTGYYFRTDLNSTFTQKIVHK